MKNAVFWDVKSQFVPHRRHITAPLQRPASYCYVRCEVLIAVTTKDVVFYDVAPYRSCKTHVSEESIDSIFKVQIPGTTRPTRRHISGEGILHNRCGFACTSTPVLENTNLRLLL
jgi:hypothetical protein